MHETSQIPLKKKNLRGAGLGLGGGMLKTVPPAGSRIFCIFCVFHLTYKILNEKKVHVHKTWQIHQKMTLRTRLARQELLFSAVGGG